ncbi:MAG: family 31 glucosidase, partial [Omnitrophica WOR_2 bacterium]
MHPQFSSEGQNLFYRKATETVWLQPWGPNAIRVRATVLPDFISLPGALLDQPEQPGAKTEIGNDRASLSNGKIRAEISNDGRIRFTHTSTGKIFLEELPYRFYRPPSRDFHASGGNNFHLEVNFLSRAGERFYGLGQHQHGLLDQKGCVIDLLQRNTEVCIPFLLSNQGYGFLWNNPAVGRVELAENATRWVAESTRQMD